MHTRPAYTLSSRIIRWYLLLLIVLLHTSRSYAQSPGWQAAVAFSQLPGGSNAHATAVSPNGDVYVAGSFNGTVTFGADRLTSRGLTDVFVAKWSRASNTFVWALRAGGASAGATAEATEVVVSGTSVYISGGFSGGSTQFGGISLTSGVYSDGFVAKVTDTGTAGTFVWAQQIGGSNDETVMALAVNGTSVYLGGYFQSTSATFGPLTITNASGPFSTDAYVAKLTDSGATGSFVWAQRAGGFGFDGVSALAVEGSNVYVAGSFSRDPATFGSITLPNAGNDDIFVAKLVDAGQSGSFSWAQGSGGQGDESAYGLAVRGSTVYVAGYFASAALSLGTATVTNSGFSSMDGFVAKLTDMGTTGRYSWAQGVGGPGGQRDDFVQSVAVSGGGVCISGTFGSPTISLGSTVLTNASTSINSADAFVAQLDDAGTSARFAWAQRAGGPGSDQAAAVAIAGTDVFVVGTLGGNATFGSLPPVSSTDASGFLARLGLPPTVRISGDTLLCNGGQLTLTATPSLPAIAYAWNTGATTPAITVAQPGSYTVTATFAGGGTAVATFRVAGLQPVVRIQGDTVLCAGSAVQLTAVAPGASAVEWSGGTQATSLSVTQPGVYRLTARYGAGCTASAQVTVISPSLQITGPAQVCPGTSNPAQLRAAAAGATAFRWNTGATTPLLSVTLPGTYTVTATFAGGCTRVATHLVTAPQAVVAGDSLLCAGSTIALAAGDAFATSYAWSTGATSPTITVAQPGSYSVLVTYPGGCTSRAQRTVRAQPTNAAFSLGADTTICEGSTLLLRVPDVAAPGSTYRWSDGSTGSTLQVRTAGLYSLERRLACGTQSASRRVTVQSCVQIGNVITPNADGLNDRLDARNLPGTGWGITIYNRWGRQVYQTSSYRNDWGDTAAAGVYYYLLRQSATGKIYKGWVEVIR